MNNGKLSVMFMQNIAIKNGGLTQAIFTRANILSKKQKKVYILTYAFQHDFKRLVDFHRKNGNISENVIVRNLYEDLDPFKGLPLFSGENIIYSDVLNSKEEILYRDEKNKSCEGYRAFNNGIYCKYYRFDDKKITSIDNFEPEWVRASQCLYDDFGNKVKERHMDKLKNKPRLDRVFSRNGKSYMTINLDVDTSKIKDIYLHYPKPEYFSAEDDMIVFWLNAVLSELISESSGLPIFLFCDKREHVNLFKKISNKNVEMGYTFHSTHLGKPHTSESATDPTALPVFDNLSMFKKVIFLTDLQREDAVNRYGNEKKFISIFNVPSEKYKIDKSIERNRFLVVSMARYHPVKALHEAIHAFLHVVKKIPKAKYEIYGYGDQKSELQKLVDDLGLKDNIFLNDFNENPLKKYQEARCSLMTSVYEGYGLSIVESMSAGCPVLSYNANYGPNSIIRNGIDGFLISWGDREKLAKLIIEVMEDDELFSKLSENAAEVNVGSRTIGCLKTSVRCCMAERYCKQFWQHGNPVPRSCHADQPS
ncbi:glycosyltransferase, partial [Comamonas testosteroni]